MREFGIGRVVVLDGEERTERRKVSPAAAVELGHGEDFYAQPEVWIAVVEHENMRNVQDPNPIIVEFKP